MISPESSGAKAAIGRIAAIAHRRQHPICFDSGPLIDFLSLLEPVASLLRPILLDATVPVVMRSSPDPR